MIEECFRNIGRIVKPGGWFDFTFDRTEGREHQVLGEDFYYRVETLLDLASRCGLQATLMEDWERLPHRQSKIRIRFPGPESSASRAVHDQDRSEADRRRDPDREAGQAMSDLL